MELPTLDKFPKRVLARIDAQRAFCASRLIIAAERMQIFRALHAKGMTADEVGRAVGMHNVYRQTVLNALVGLGLLQKTNGKYRNTRLAEKYFIAERSIYWTRQYSKECVQAYEALLSLEKTLETGRRTIAKTSRKNLNYIDAMKKDQGQAEDFTQMLFHFHRQDAAALARCLDLSKHRAVLDVGGGSGVMSIALAQRNPGLRCCVLDLANVCRVATRNIRQAGLAHRVRTMAGDIKDPLPGGYDVVLFCDIGPISRRLLRNAYQCLPADGLVVAVDRYLSKDGTDPLDRVLAQLVGSSFPLASRAEMVGSLKSSGFERVKARVVHSDVWAVSGMKLAEETR